MSFLYYNGPTPSFFLGGTVFFSVSFLDQNGNPANPISAVVNLVYQAQGGGTKNVSISMSVTGFQWAASWVADSEAPVLAAVGTVYGSIQSSPLLPAVRDFQFFLSANPANLALDT
jgi:hypothetical protein